MGTSRVSPPLSPQSAPTHLAIPNTQQKFLTTNFKMKAKALRGGAWHKEKK